MNRSTITVIDTNRGGSGKVTSCYWHGRAKSLSRKAASENLSQSSHTPVIRDRPRDKLPSPMNWHFKFGTERVTNYLLQWINTLNSGQNASQVTFSNELTLKIRDRTRHKLPSPMNKHLKYGTERAISCLLQWIYTSN